MNFAEIYHRTSDNYCYPLNENELIINLRTGYDIEKVFIFFGDPFWIGNPEDGCKPTEERKEISFSKCLKHQMWWTTTVEPKYKRCKYFFELHSKDEIYYYFEDSFYNEDEVKQPNRKLRPFVFPWMNKADINATPNWVKDTVWYQIFPERFCNGDKNNDPENVLPWKSQVTGRDDFYGGDLQGIIDKLDYLQDLGVTGIYMTPIFDAPSIHKYDTKDYFAIDKHFGDEKLFGELVNRAHEKKIRIMIDGVFNHSGNLFPQWQDVIENGPKSKYFDWFMVNKWPFESNKDTCNGDFYSFAFTPMMPKLNTNNSEVREFIISVVKYWKEFGIDGLRLDVANELSHRLCKELRTALKDIDNEFYILGEIWNDSMAWLRGDEFDAVMNYPLSNSMFNFWLNKEQTKRDFEYAINNNYCMYMQQTNEVLFNLLDSHDTMRLINRVGDIDVFYQQLAVLYTMPGSPCIYYGTEIALEGADDPDCRRCMPWEDIEKGMYNDRINEVKSLIKLRKSNEILRNRHIHFNNEIANERVIEYTKSDRDFNMVKVILNASDVEIDVPKGKKVLYERLCANGKIMPKGIYIVEI